MAHNDRTDSSLRLTSLLYACSAAYMNALTFGCAIGYMSPSLSDILHRNIYSRLLSSYTSFSVLDIVTAIGGAVVCAWTLERYGRRKSLLYAAVTSVVGWLLIVLTPSVTMLFAGRPLTGLAGGMTVVCSPLYVAEVSTKELRGMLGSGVQLFITIGILTVNVIDVYSTYYTLAGVCLVVSVLAAYMATRVPESPRWLLLRNRKTDALHTLEVIRSAHQVDVEDECRDIEESLHSDAKIPWRDFAKSQLLGPLKVTLGLIAVNQLCGVNTVMLHTEEMFAEVGLISGGDRLAACLVGAVQVLAMFVACVLMDRFERRGFLILSGVGMSLSCLMFSYHYIFGGLYKPLPIVSLVLYIASFSLGWGPVSLLISSEIFPLRTRGAANALVVVTNWTLAFIVSLGFHSMHKWIGPAFLFHCACCMIGVWFVWKKVPEIKGKSLEDIELYFRGGRVTDCSHHI